MSLVLVLISACHNADITYDDYVRQTLYFPIQYPVRTLSLGNDIVDNSIDRQHKFHIGVNVGGYYDINKQDWHVSFVIDPSLVFENHLQNSDGVTIKPLPEEYYTLDPSEVVIIPKGSFAGLIEVSLTDAFFADPRALTGEYVIPLRLTTSPETESILHGVPFSDAPSPPDVHVPSHWEVQPMDYTLFGIKYVNPYHGQWLRRGMMLKRNVVGAIVDTTAYHAEFVENNEVVALVTTSLTSVVSSMNVGKDNFSLNIEVGQDGVLTVTSTLELGMEVTYGTGRYKENGDAWGGTPEKPTLRDAIYLNYFYDKIEGGQIFTCEVNDTLVFRNRGIKYEANHPTVK